MKIWHQFIGGILNAAAAKLIASTNNYPISEVWDAKMKSDLQSMMALSGCWTGKRSSSMSGPFRQTWPLSQVRDTNTRRGSCLPVTMWPSSLTTSQCLQPKHSCGFPDPSNKQLFENFHFIILMKKMFKLSYFSFLNMNVLCSHQSSVTTNWTSLTCPDNWGRHVGKQVVYNYGQLNKSINKSSDRMIDNETNYL